MRARAVDVSRVRADGSGQRYPIASNDSVEGQRQNRRIVVAAVGALDVSGEDAWSDRRAPGV